MISLSLQATQLGLFARQIGAYDREKARELFRVPPGIEPVTIVAFGYFGGTEHITHEQRARERRPRERLTQDDLVFRGRWGTPFE